MIHIGFLTVLLILAHPLTVYGSEDVAPGPPFATGDEITIDQVDKLRSYIPRPFWEHREYFFFEGMHLRIGAFHADYGPSELHRQVTEKYKGLTRIGRSAKGSGWLEFYVAGTPFPEIDSEDPDAGLKIAWNSTYRHDPMEGSGRFRLSFWEPGQTVSSFAFQGEFWGLRLANRIDRAMDGDGRYFPDDERKAAGRIRLELPLEWRTLAAIGYRYLKADTEPLVDEARDVWAWIPDLRRVRRIPGSTEEQETIPGTDFMVEDIDGFNFSSGLTQKYTFKLVGEAEVLSPIDTTRKAYPLVESPNLGPGGYSFADDIWQLRDTWILSIRKKKKHPTYSKKLLWVDKQTYMPLYAAAYDSRGELWRLIYLVHRWSESPAHQEVIRNCKDSLHHKRKSRLAHAEAKGAERFLYPIGHVIVNVRNGKGNRIEAWDAHATQIRDKDVKRNLASNRLSIGGR